LSSFASSVGEQLKTLWNNQRNIKQAIDSSEKSYYSLEEHLNEANRTKINHSEILSEAMAPEFQAINSSLHLMDSMQIYNLTFEPTRNSTKITETPDIIESSTVTPDMCGDDEFLCSESSPLHCIQKSYICDGDNDCGNNEDERNCTPTANATPITCSHEEFFCSEHAPDPCIQKSQVCDGYNDCGDNKDETNCTNVHSYQV